MSISNHISTPNTARFAGTQNSATQQTLPTASTPTVSGGKPVIAKNSFCGCITGPLFTLWGCTGGLAISLAGQALSGLWGVTGALIPKLFGF